jgi:ribose-phosphate pyrophosphokinase
MSRVLVLASRSYAYMQAAVCAAGGFEAGVVEVKSFPDGERYQRLRCDVEDRDVVVLGGTIGDVDTLEVYDLACTVAKCGAHSLTIAIPYFGYSTMERAVHPGEVVTAKTRARLLSSIPAAHEANRIVLLDLHSEGLPHYFEGDVRPIHVYAKSVILEAVRELGGVDGGGRDNGPGDFVVACTDAGRAKWVESLANELGVPASFVFKRRLDGDRTQVTAVSAQVAGRRVVIYDDMIRTGGSLLEAAKAYRDAGAASIAAVATHGLFPGEALARLRDSGLLTRVVVTDSHPRAVQLGSDFLEVRSVASVFAAALLVRT